MISRSCYANPISSGLRLSVAQDGIAQFTYACGQNQDFQGRLSLGWRATGCLGIKIIFEAWHHMNLSNSKSVRQVGIFMLRVLACLVLVATITWIAFSVLNVNALIVGFAYVLAVLVVAARWGLTESFVTSVAA